MRRIFLALAFASSALPALAMPDPGPASVRNERTAIAMFTFPDGGDDRFPFVAAVAFGYSVDGENERLFGAFVKGNCVRERGKNWVSIGCSGRSGVGGRLRDGEFQMDPALRSASMDLSEKGKTYRVQWAAHEGPGLFQASEWCFSNGSEEPDGEGHGGGVYQDALARGSAFGRKLESSGRWVDHASMDEGGMVTQCTWLSSRDMDALRAGRYEDVTFELRRDR